MDTKQLEVLIERVKHNAALSEAFCNGAKLFSSVPESIYFVEELAASASALANQVQGYIATQNTNLKSQAFEIKAPSPINAVAPSLNPPTSNKSIDQLLGCSIEDEVTHNQFQLIGQNKVDPFTYLARAINFTPPEPISYSRVDFNNAIAKNYDLYTEYLNQYEPTHVYTFIQINPTVKFKII